jgi:hypothetical protein
LTIIHRHHYFVTLVEIRQFLSSILLNMLSVNWIAQDKRSPRSGRFRVTWTCSRSFVKEFLM